MKQTNLNDDFIKKEILPRLKSEIDTTLEARKNVVDLRAKKIDQDLEQVRTYLNILEAEKDLNLNPRALKRLENILSWKPKSERKCYCEQQEEIEKHFLDLQKSLVGLISKKFKY